jgi:hypothetical protein
VNAALSLWTTSSSRCATARPDPEAQMRSAAGALISSLFGGQQAEQDRVATRALERDMRPKDALTGEPAPLGNAL